MERARVEQDLRTSEQRYRQVYETVSDVIFHVNVEPDGQLRVGAVNPAFAKVTGLAPEAVLGKRIEEVVPHEARTLIIDAYRTAIAQRRSVSWEQTSALPSGRRHAHVQVSPVVESDGSVTHLIGTAHDVTAYKLAEEKIAAQAALLDKARDAIAVLNLDETVRYWNEGAARLYGVGREAALGRPYRELVESEGPGIPHARLLNEGQIQTELTRTMRSGSQRTTLSRITLVRDERGQPSSYLLIETDITEQKAIELEFQRRQRIDSLGTLAGGIAHDFNNILSGILGNVDAAREHAAHAPRVVQSLEEIEKAAFRAADLTQRILAFSRHSASHHTGMDLRVPIAEAVALLRATILPPIRIGSRLASDVPLVLGDSTAIHQVVMNLGTNAAHAVGAHGGSIDVELTRFICDERRAVTVGELHPGCYAVITVRDDGCGMDPSTMAQMFEPFFTTKGKHGTGLGLSVVHGIVTSHGAALEVESVEGKGTAFRLFLRGADTPEVAQQPAVREPREEQGRGQLALFVDDEETLVALARELLPTYGYRVEAYSDPVAALRAFEGNAQGYDVLVTDSAMSGMTGYELASAVRALRPELAVVVASSESSESAPLFQALGVDEILTKP